MSVQGSAAAAPQSAGQSGSSEGAGLGQGGDSGGAGGDAFDYRAAFTSTQRALEDTRKEFTGFKKTVEERDKRYGDSADKISKIQEIFNPKEQSAPDPVVEWERQMDYYIEQALEADKAGRGMPLTTNLAISHYKSMIENHRQRTELMETIQALKGQVESLSNPSHAVNQQAYGQIDSNIKRGLDALYGAGDDNLPQKQALFQAVGQQIAGVLQELQQKNPRRWDMMRRDPQALQDLANRALKMNVPPKALQMLEEEQLRNTPMGLAELRQAFKEADSIKDPRERGEVKTKIRQEIFAAMNGSGRR